MIRISRLAIMVAGTTFQKRQDCCESIDVGERVWLQREPDNPYDGNAILVKSKDLEVLGYVPRRLAADLAPILDSRCRQDAVVKKLLQTSRGHTLPVIVARLYSAASEMGEVFTAIASFQRKAPALSAVNPATSNLTEFLVGDSNARRSSEQQSVLWIWIVGVALLLGLVWAFL